ncbi:MAG: hypothetical protein D3916_13275 [Candidatus Electrothrix sp. MAN1_4]|nr:hypothetical protein [Candidatus Electrothrix sp. MAN1_4]
MTIQAYFTQFLEVVDQYAAAGFVVATDVRYETRQGDQGYLSGTLLFIDSSTLHFSEYLDQAGGTADRLMYTYHYQDAKNRLIFRYDNARHKPPLSSPDHKHLHDRIIETPAPVFEDILIEIVTLKGWGE